MSVRQVANDEKEGATVMKHEHYMDMNRLSDWSVEQINELLDTCLLLKEMEEKGVRLPLLKDVVLAMMFDQQSTPYACELRNSHDPTWRPCHVPGWQLFACRFWPRGYR